MNCDTPDETATVVVDYFMMILSFVCLIVTIYGTNKYLKFWRLQENATVPASLFWGGLIFFNISSLTLINALLYDILYLVCTNLDKYEGPVYHSIYFLQIYSLWIMLFLRIYYIFKNSHFGLSKYVIIAYRISFALIIIIVIPIYVLFGLQTDSLITLPFVTLSIIFCTSLVIIFAYKLCQLFTKFGVGDQFVLDTMAKNVLLAIISLSCTVIVFIVLISLEIVHKGHYEKHTVFQEFILELFILSDVISNFLCILLTYSFFDKQYNKFCGVFHTKFVSFFEKRLAEHIKDKSENTKTSELTITKNKTLDSNEIHSVVLTLNDGNEKMVETELISNHLKKSLKAADSWPVICKCKLMNFVNSNNNHGVDIVNDNHGVDIPLILRHSAPIIMAGKIK